jgi:hypothetical protein
MPVARPACIIRQTNREIVMDRYQLGVTALFISIMFSTSLARADEDDSATCRKLAATATNGCCSRPLTDADRAARRETVLQQITAQLGEGTNTQIAHRLTNRAFYLSTIEGMTRGEVEADLYSTCLSSI